MNENARRRGRGPSQCTGVALIALAAVCAAALSGCLQAQGLDLVNTCDVPITLYGGEYDAAEGATPNMYDLQPHATASSYILDGRPAVFYLLREGEDEWRGPVTVAPDPDASDTRRYELSEDWCE